MVYCQVSSVAAHWDLEQETILANYSVNQNVTIKFVLMLGVAIMLSGCMARTVQEKDRNTDGSYDGNWTGTIGRTPSQVLIENWRISCWDMAGSLRLRINDGQVLAIWRSHNGSSYINDKGKFRIVIPRNVKPKHNSANVGSLIKNKNYIITGSLSQNKATGRLTSGYEDFANQGCSSKINYTKK